MSGRESELGSLQFEYDPFRNGRPAGSFAREIAELRERAACFRSTTAQGFWVLTRFDQIREAYQTPEIFSSEALVAIEPDPPYKWIPIMLDPPEHTTWRHLLGPLFSPARALAMQGQIRQRARELVEPLVAKGACDFVADFALKYPTTIFMELMGLPVEEAERFMAWEDAILHSYADDREGAFLAMAEVCTYFAELIDARRADPRDDVVSAAITWTIDGNPVDDDDLLSLCLLLFMAGLDTVTQQLGYSWLHLATHHADRTRIVEDPAIIPDAVEELLRAYAIVAPGRKLRRDVDFHGCPMQAGDMVYLPLWAATTDPREFANADTVDFDRKDNHHIAFGAGPHRCLGSHLARQELRVAFEEWHRLIPDYQLANAADVTEHSGGVHGIDALPLVWTAP